MIFSYISHLRYETPACVRSTTLIKAAQYDARVSGKVCYYMKTQHNARLGLMCFCSARCGKSLGCGGPLRRSARLRSWGRRNYGSTTRSGSSSTTRAAASEKWARKASAPRLRGLGHTHTHTHHSLTIAIATATATAWDTSTLATLQMWRGHLPPGGRPALRGAAVGPLQRHLPAQGVARPR